MLNKEDYSKLKKSFKTYIKGISLNDYNNFWDIELKPNQIIETFISNKDKNNISLKNLSPKYTYLSFITPYLYCPYLITKKTVQIKKTHITEFCCLNNLTKIQALQMLLNNHLLGLYDEETGFVYGI